jgi:hypothetical protein
MAIHCRTLTLSLSAGPAPTETVRGDANGICQRHVTQRGVKQTTPPARTASAGCAERLPRAAIPSRPHRDQQEGRTMATLLRGSIWKTE